MRGWQSNFECCRRHIFDPTVSLTSLRIMFDMKARFGMKHKSTDFSEFFLETDVRDGEHYFMEIPEGWSDLDSRLWVAEINKTVYGLPTSTQVSGQELVEFLCSKEIGFKPCVHDPKLLARPLSRCPLSYPLIPPIEK